TRVPVLLSSSRSPSFVRFFFPVPATTEIFTLSLHDALPILATVQIPAIGYGIRYDFGLFRQVIIDGWQHEFPDVWLSFGNPWERSEEHTSELQSHLNLVCRLLLEKKKI